MLFLRLVLFVICQNINVVRFIDSSRNRILQRLESPRKFLQIRRIPEREREREREKERSRFRRCNDQKLSNYFHGTRRGVSRRAHGGDSACREERRSERLSTARVS